MKKNCSEHCYSELEMMTERKLVDGKLHKTRLFHQKILDSVADPLFVKDSNYRYVFVNEAFCNFVRRDCHELIGKNDFDLFQNSEAEIFRSIDELVVSSGDGHINEEQLTDPDGLVHLLSTKKTLYVDEHGEKFIVCILRDITAQRLAEKNLDNKSKGIAAMAIELSLAEARERMSIASELHDHIGQTLILARIKLAMLDQMPKNDEYDKTLALASSLIDQVIQNVRSLTVQISPPLLTSAGLETALESLSRQMMDDYGLRVEFHDDQLKKPLNEELRSIVYKAARELLINVAKHANTDSARVYVGRDGAMLFLAVEDSGKGFDTGVNSMDACTDCSFGLFSIQQRVQAMGGHFDITSKPGVGTRVIIKVPLSQEG